MSTTGNTDIHTASKRHWSDKRDAQHRHTDERWFRLYADELLALLPHGGGLRDVGCGACQITTYLAASYERVLGIDFADSMLDSARRRIAERGLPHLAVVNGDGTRSPPSP